MKFTVPVACLRCGCNFETPGYGTTEFPLAECPQCNEQIHILDPLTISVVADRLLQRAYRENNDGDFTISIICSTIAVECALTQVFLKWKKLDHFRSTQQEPPKTEQVLYENEYRKKTSPGGFKKAADFVSNFLIKKDYDEFVSDLACENSKIKWIKAGLPQYENQVKSDYIHENLFVKRNRIMHWGDVSYNNTDASTGLIAACAAISVLKAIDRRRYLTMEQEWRSSMKLS